MPRIVRGALLQASWTGDKESMIQKHEGFAHEAAKQGDPVPAFRGRLVADGMLTAEQARPVLPELHRRWRRQRRLSCLKRRARSTRPRPRPMPR